MQQLIKLINPKRIFRRKKSKDRSKKSKDGSTVSRSDQSSFASSSSAASEDAQMKTPTSVLPDTERLDLPQAFKLMDKDKDGLIAKAEVAAVLSRLGAEPISQEEVAWMLKEEEEGGCVRLEALASRLGSACEAAGEEELRETFEYFDRDGDGRITAEELLRVFREGIGDEACTLEDCQRMISVVDNTGHGFVYFPDFARMMLLQR